MASKDTTKERKYERVETVDIDKKGNAELKDVREDRGKEDPGMNFQDKRPAGLVPDGRVLNASETELQRKSGSSASSHSHHSHSSHSSGFVEPTLGKTAGSEYSSSSSASRTTTTSGTGGAIGHSHGAPTGMTTTQRTTVVTEQVQGVGQQRTVPIIPHEQREEREVIQHESQSRTPETKMVTIPVTHFESAKMESVREGRTYTEDKPLTIPAPQVAPQIHAHQTIDLGGGTHAQITAHSDVNLKSEAEIKDMGPEEYALYRAKVEALARQHEQETSQKAATYRSQVEKDAELIRQTLERQHIRDIEFRTDMVESAVDRQEMEIQLEAEYAMKALEKEREAARAALNQAKMSTSIDVNIESAVGTTHSQGRMTTTSEARAEEKKGPSTTARI